MAVKIRMRRTGANKDISYRIVAADGRCPKEGKSLETLGWYDPKVKGKNFSLKMDRLNHWIEHGAIVSETVKSLIKKSAAK